MGNVISAAVDSLLRALPSNDTFITNLLTPQSASCQLAGGLPNVGMDLPNIDNLFPVGPVPQAAGTGGVGANGGQNQAGAQAFNITIERIEVNAEGGDAQEIAANIADSLAQQVRSMVEQVDTRVRA